MTPGIAASPAALMKGLTHPPTGGLPRGCNWPLFNAIIDDLIIDNVQAA
jgi:hypothetical protein